MQTESPQPPLFYDQLGEKFDRMIRWKQRLERETPFFQRLFSEHRVTRLLDLACGSGHHARLFHKWGTEVVGVDPSEKLLSIAREAGGSEDSLRFVEGDFSNFHERVTGQFDLVISLGNSLSHVSSEQELRDLFARVRGVLKPGGIFVFQNRNYDRLLQTQERFLFPSTHRMAETDEIFFRFNDFLEDKVRFNIVHFTRVGESWIHEVHSTELSPWRHKELDEWLHEAGFGSLDFYGDFSSTPFDPPSSSDLVCMAQAAEA